MMCVCMFSFVFPTLPSNHYSLIPTEGESTVLCLTSFRDKTGPTDGLTNVEGRKVLKYSDEKCSTEEFQASASRWGSVGEQGSFVKHLTAVLGKGSGKYQLSRV